MLRSLAEIRNEWIISILLLDFVLLETILTCINGSFYNFNNLSLFSNIPKTEQIVIFFSNFLVRSATLIKIFMKWISFFEAVVAVAMLKNIMTVKTSKRMTTCQNHFSKPTNSLMKAQALKIVMLLQMTLRGVTWMGGPKSWDLKRYDFFLFFCDACIHYNSGLLKVKNEKPIGFDALVRIGVWETEKLRYTMA